MGTSIAGTLSATQVQQAQNQAQAIASSASQTINEQQFVFFAAFDGTNNNANDPSSIRAGEQTTNVGQLFNQYDKNRQSNPNLGGRYYPGPGTSGSLPGSSAIPPQVTQEAINTGTRAFGDFEIQASNWLRNHPHAAPQASIAVAITAFSRGIDAAAVFSQLLYEKGLNDTRTGEVLIPPGQLGVSAGVIYDPVATGMSGNIGFPLARNVVVIQAANDYRYAFKAVDYTGQPGFSTFDMAGNHCDIGGGYDNGLGALNLEAATQYFQRAGLALADVPAERQFDANRDVVIHNEAMNDYGKEMWSAYGTYGEYSGPRLTTSRAQGAQSVTDDAGTMTTTFKDYAKRDVTHVSRKTEEGTEASFTLVDYFNGTTSTVKTMMGESIGNPASFGKQPDPPAPPDLDQPGHARHAMYRQAQAGVYQLDAGHNRTPDQRSDQLAASLVVAGRKEGLERIDSVWLNDDASKVFAVQGEPRTSAMLTAGVPTVAALDTPIAQSSRMLEQVEQQNREQAEARAWQQAQAQTQQAEQSQQFQRQSAMAR